MERKLQERMVGAAVLIAALVIVGPMILDGARLRDHGDKRGESPDIPGQRSDELMQTARFRLNQPPTPDRVNEPVKAPVEARTRAPADAPGAPPADTPPGETTDAASPAVPPPPPAVSPPQVSTAMTPAPPAKPATTPPATPAAPPSDKSSTSGSGFVVQLGVFEQKQNAQRLATSLNGKGFAATVSATQRAGKSMYRVRVGPAGTRTEAAALTRRLAAAGAGGGQVVAQ